MLEVEIKIKGRQWGDVALAAEEALKKLRKESVAGADSNDTGGFSFSVKGEPDDAGDYEE